ncbi:MAG: SDR family NAD(P)-dependent oxidoreductase [Firmicutes bacterium]|nr:SDR family NAD(P)-dependent oxidoreductase [Bacillota bacterium]
MNQKVMENANNFFGLEGKSAIVTGAGNGIGKAIAVMLASLGANVMACDIEADSVANTAREITKEGYTAISCPCDITKMEEIKETVRQTVEKYGTVDILVNCGATMGGGKHISEVNPKEWDRLITTNLTGVYNFCWEVIPIMREKQSGKIINISSGAGVTGEDCDIHYSAAKAGVIGLTKSLAQELGHERINVNCVAPGFTNTRMAHEWEFEPALKIFYKIGQPEDQAAAVAFLASEAANFFSGQVLSPNGGAYMI